MLFFLLLKRIPRSSNIIFFEDTSSIIKESFPLWITTVSLYVLVQADLWIIGYFSSPDDVALYGAASRLIIMISLFYFNYLLCSSSNCFRIKQNKRNEKTTNGYKRISFWEYCFVKHLYSYLFLFFQGKLWNYFLITFIEMEERFWRF